MPRAKSTGRRLRRTKENRKREKELEIPSIKKVTRRRTKAKTSWSIWR